MTGGGEGRGGDGRGGGAPGLRAPAGRARSRDARGPRMLAAAPPQRRPPEGSPQLGGLLREAPRPWSPPTHPPSAAPYPFPRPSRPLSPVPGSFLPAVTAAGSWPCGRRLVSVTACHANPWHAACETSKCSHHFGLCFASACRTGPEGYVFPQPGPFWAVFSLSLLNKPLGLCFPSAFWVRLAWLAG